MTATTENKALIAITGLLMIHAAVKFFDFGMDLYTLPQIIKAVPAMLLLGAGYGVIMHLAGIALGTSTFKQGALSLAIAVGRGATYTAVLYFVMWSARQILHMFV
jgi:hypothetical protein